MNLNTLCLFLYLLFFFQMESEAQVNIDSLTAKSSNDKIINVRIWEDSLYSIFFIDFEANYSFYRDFYSPGIKQSEGRFSVITYDTTQTFYDAIFLVQTPVDGTMEMLEHEFHAQKQGLWIYYYSNGQILYKVNYDQNLKHGNWEYYSDKGDIQIIRTYNKGVMVEEKIVAKGIYINPG